MKNDPFAVAKKYLEVKKNPDGKVLARRTDGRPLTSEDREEAKRLIETQADKAILAGPPCWNCGAQMAETTDIYARVWWKCWGCATNA